MIKAIEFQNYKALRNTTLPLGRFTLIVGPNGSGKSTAIQALLSVRGRHLDYARSVSVGAPANSVVDVKLQVDLGHPKPVIAKMSAAANSMNFGLEFSGGGAVPTGVDPLVRGVVDS